MKYLSDIAPYRQQRVIPLLVFGIVALIRYGNLLTLFLAPVGAVTLRGLRPKGASPAGKYLVRNIPGVLVLLAALAVGAAAKTDDLPGTDSRWRSYCSGNFELYSNGEDDEARDLLHSLELVRAVFQDWLKATERARLEVTVYVFRRRPEFQAYCPESMRQGARVDAYYADFPDRAVIVVSPTQGWETARQVVFHEYIHHLFRVSELEPSLWFNEGTAELLAGIRPMNDTVEIGRPHAGRLAVLQFEPLLPFETLFTVDEHSPIYRSETHAGMFYAESWALLHYWYCGDSKLRPDAVKRFVQVAGDTKVSRKMNLPAYFQDCFGLTYGHMQRQLQSYVRSGSYHFGRLPRPTIDAAKSYPMRAVPPDEVNARLAELALRVNRSASAKIILRDFAATHPADPRPLEALGTEALADDDEITAKERWEAAIAAGSRNTAVYRELALRETRPWFESFDFDFRLPADIGARLREQLLRSIESEPAQTAPYEMLAWVEAFSDQPIVANVNLVQHNFGHLRQKARTVLALACVRLRFGQPEETRQILGELAALDPDPWTTAAAANVRERLPPRPTAPR